jgi:hypothetical protein
MFDAEDIATKFATKEHDADLMRLSSAGVYMDPNDMPHILNNGALQLTTLDATIKSVIVNACLALHADAAALAVERLVSPGRDSFFSATTFARNGFTANLTPPSAGSPLPSTLDCQLLVPKLIKKKQKARRLKRLADLALLAGSPLDV